MMTHLFNSNCRCRLNGVSKWFIACPKNVKQSPSKTLQLRVQNTTNIGRYQNNLCPSNLRTGSGFNFWIQIRYQKEWPRFHRDIQLPNFDPYRKKEYKDVTKTKWGSGDDKLGYTYFIAFFGFMCGTYCVKCELIHYVTFMGTPADVIALASIEVELGKIPLGACVAYKWRGKPIFIRHRTIIDIENEAKTPLSELRDPETPEQRTINPEWLIVVGICTHLGCVPIPNSGDWPGGFYCPCHGSHYDSVGRARKGPAPLNLEVPSYKFISDTLVLVG